ncbi:MAG: hypothetical protein Q9N34_02795 [Aquificota bacterium]|nr:hypothetical protein [Aquificota bacterium]
MHLDHSADLNTLIEACSDGGRLRTLTLFSPRSALGRGKQGCSPLL